MGIGDLIKEAKNGNAVAKRYLFNLFYQRMLMLCRRYVKNEHDAEDMVSEGFCNFFEHLGSFEYTGEAALYQWLKKIMINECLMFLRKKNVFAMVPETVLEEVHKEHDALDRMESAEIYNMILQLPVGYRTVFNLAVIEGRQHSEIAGMLNISESSSRSQLTRAKIVLQKMIVAKGGNYETKQYNR